MENTDPYGIKIHLRKLNYKAGVVEKHDEINPAALPCYEEN
jgi:hypothetical protein